MKDAVLVQIQRIAGQYKAIQKVVLFGSRARQDHEPQSDYDIAIFAPALTGREQVLFRNELECIDTFHKIDVVFIEKRHKGSELYHHILRDGVILMDKFQIKLNNFQNAVARLHEALEEAQMNNSLTVRDGVIQRFEFTSELAWKTVREYLLTLEVSDINNPKNVMGEAYRNQLITDEDGWLQILRDRNTTSYIYDDGEAEEIFPRIAGGHIILFDELLHKLLAVR